MLIDTANMKAWALKIKHEAILSQVDRNTIANYLDDAARALEEAERGFCKLNLSLAEQAEREMDKIREKLNAY